MQVQGKLAAGAVYDATYVDHYIETNREFLPEGFGRNDVHIATDCPEGPGRSSLGGRSGGGWARWKALSPA